MDWPPRHQNNTRHRDHQHPTTRHTASTNQTPYDWDRHNQHNHQYISGHMHRNDIDMVQLWQTRQNHRYTHSTLQTTYSILHLLFQKGTQLPNMQIQTRIHTKQPIWRRQQRTQPTKNTPEKTLEQRQHIRTNTSNTNQGHMQCTNKHSSPAFTHKYPIDHQQDLYKNQRNTIVTNRPAGKFPTEDSHDAHMHPSNGRNRGTIGTNHYIPGYRQWPHH